jgi:hypothetical protein
MNWRRGLFRAWLALTILWCVIVGWRASSAWLDPWRVVATTDSATGTTTAVPFPFLTYVAIALGVPILTFGFSWACCWVAKGFSIPPQNEGS